MKTAHHYLSAGFTKKAIELASQDPQSLKWRKDGQSLLHIAAHRNDVEAVTWLLDHGADVDAQTYNNFTPLHLTSDARIVAMLLAKTPEFMQSDLRAPLVWQSPFHQAIERLQRAQNEADSANWRKIVDLYLAAGVECDLFAAIHLDDLARVKQILEADPRWAKGSGQLRTAARLGRVEICKLLVEQYGADVDDFKGGNGYPVIMEAVRHPRVVQLLIAHGADLETRITWHGGRTGIWIIGDDATALHYAAEANSAETVKLLINSGVDIFATAHDSSDEASMQTALEVAAYFGSAAAAEAIVKHPKFDVADAEMRQQLLDKCLCISADSSWLARNADRAKLMQVLLAKGANPNASLHGSTALQNAVADIHPTHLEESQACRRVAAVLRSHGAKIDAYTAVVLGEEAALAAALAIDAAAANAAGPEGRPALHVAVGMDYRNIVALLIEAGCDLEIRNHSESTGTPEETALHVAAFWGRDEIAQILIEAGANVNARCQGGATPLHESARMTTVGVAKLLLDHGADANAHDDEGETPLGWLQERYYGNPAKMRQLLAAYQAKSGK